MNMKIKKKKSAKPSACGVATHAAAEADFHGMPLALCLRGTALGGSDYWQPQLQVTLLAQFYLLRSLVVMSTAGSTAVHVFRVESLSVRA